MAGEVAGRRDKHALADGQAPHHKARVLNRPVPHDGVVTLGGGVHPAVVEFERQFDKGMLDQEWVQGRSEVQAPQGRFSLLVHMPGLNRPMGAGELSDGTLRYLLWTAALLTPRPPELLVLNEPESSLHPDLLPGRTDLSIHRHGAPVGPGKAV